MEMSSDKTESDSTSNANKPTSSTGYTGGFLSPFSSLLGFGKSDSSSEMNNPSTSSSDSFQVPDIPVNTKPAPSVEMFPARNSAQRASNSSTAPPRKVPLGVGYSPLDWANLKISLPSQSIRRFTLTEVAQHKTSNDLWIVLQGKVYNVTSYLPFHPGGKSQLLRGAGKDATELFFKVHPWVNADRLLDKCFIGYLVKD